MNKNKYTIQALTNSPELRLELYKEMLLEWQKPLQEAYTNTTFWGFDEQLYFRFKISLGSKFETVLPELYWQRENIYPDYGKEYFGREIRKVDLQKSIEKCLKYTKHAAVTVYSQKTE